MKRKPRLWFLRKLVRNERGQSFVEFAIIVPVLILLVAGGLMFGILVNTKLVVAGAAREAARKYSETADPSAAREVATYYLRGALTGSSSTINCAETGNKCAMSIQEVKDGDNWYVKVTVRYMQDTYFGRVLFLPRTMPQYGVAVFRMAPL